MRLETYQDDLGTLRRRVFDQRLAIGILSLCLLLALSIIYRIAGTERTIITPPSVSKTFWVEDGRGSNDYLVQMSSFVAYLMLDVTPKSIEWKKDMLLKWCLPDNAGAIKTRQELEATRLKKLNASTYFQLQQLVPDEETQSVLLTGFLLTQVNGVKTSDVQKSYRADFIFRGGRVHLKDFKEVDRENPNSVTDVAVAGVR
ncbi:type IV conjugative transfer system protein TraE [Janthinobacterium sp. PSPC3-1]|uniref:type IV conjugative transfer system protein TraE n=1 Tax=Janthinobacterium sp. PSPC3-1 TaxID=2804653 RepID=UPI003CE8F161